MADEVFPGHGPEDLTQDNGSSSPTSSSASSSRRPSRNPSFYNAASWFNEDSEFTPLDKLSVFDLFDNLDLQQQLERLNRSLNLKKHREKVKEQYVKQKERVMKKRNEELERYKQKYGQALDKVMDKWSDTTAVTLREKISFVGGVTNIFVTGVLVGGYPDWVHIYYSLQLIYFMPLRFITYHKKGYHYFLADLCYFVNLLLLLAVWVFPNSRRLFISTYCLAYGNNAWAIAMWRNSLVFHSLDKVTSLFIHIMPPLVLHCLVHQLDPAYLEVRFPAIHRVKTVEKYGMIDMIIWATLPYAFWQISYHFMITVRRAAQIAAGRPTSFTWLRKSYAKTWIGKMVLKLPESLQEVAFMMIQYTYALITMLPCALWLNSRLSSGAFLAAVAVWSVYNGAIYYIDVFGKRFQNELEQLKKDLAKLQNTPPSPYPSPSADKFTFNSEASIPKGETVTTTSTTGVERISGAEGMQDGEVRERNVTCTTSTTIT